MHATKGKLHIWPGMAYGERHTEARYYLLFQHNSLPGSPLPPPTWRFKDCLPFRAHVLVNRKSRTREWLASLQLRAPQLALLPRQISCRREGEADRGQNRSTLFRSQLPAFSKCAPESGRGSERFSRPNARMAVPSHRSSRSFCAPRSFPISGEIDRRLFESSGAKVMLRAFPVA